MLINYCYLACKKEFAMIFCLVKRKLLGSLVLSLLMISSAAVNASEPLKTPTAWVYSVEADFDEVKDDLLLAIEGKGIVVSYIAHASKMFTRTSAALGIKENVYHKAEIILFCKAEISHELVQTDPHNLVLCPYPIAIYSLAKQPKVTYISTKKPPNGVPSYDAIHKLLVDIIKETIEF